LTCALSALLLQDEMDWEITQSTPSDNSQLEDMQLAAENDGTFEGLYRRQQQLVSKADQLQQTAAAAEHLLQPMVSYLLSLERLKQLTQQQKQQLDELFEQRAQLLEQGNQLKDVRHPVTEVRRSYPLQGDAAARWAGKLDKLQQFLDTAPPQLLQLMQQIQEQAKQHQQQLHEQQQQQQLNVGFFGGQLSSSSYGQSLGCSTAAATGGSVPGYSSTLAALRNAALAAAVAQHGLLMKYPFAWYRQAGTDLYAKLRSSSSSSSSRRRSAFAQQTAGYWRQFMELIGTGQVKLLLKANQQSFQGWNDATWYETSRNRSDHKRCSRQLVVQLLPGPGGLELPSPNQVEGPLVESSTTTVDDAWGQLSCMMKSDFRVFWDLRSRVPAPVSQEEMAGGLGIPSSKYDAASDEDRLAAARLKVILLVMWQLQRQKDSPVHIIGGGLLQPREPTAARSVGTTEAGELSAINRLGKIG
jgi:hypothetical protein